MVLPGSCPPKFTRRKTAQDPSFNVILWRLEIPAQQLAERPFEQPADRLNNNWSYILFDRTGRWTGGWTIAMSKQIGWTATFLLQLCGVSDPSSGLVPVRSFLSP